MLEAHVEWRRWKEATTNEGRAGCVYKGKVPRKSLDKSIDVNLSI